MTAIGLFLVGCGLFGFVGLHVASTLRQRRIESERDEYLRRMLADMKKRGAARRLELGKAA